MSGYFLLLSVFIIAYYITYFFPKKNSSENLDIPDTKCQAPSNINDKNMSIDHRHANFRTKREKGSNLFPDTTPNQHSIRNLIPQTPYYPDISFYKNS